MFWVKKLQIQVDSLPRPVTALSIVAPLQDGYRTTDGGGERDPGIRRERAPGDLKDPFLRSRYFPRLDSSHAPQ